MKRLQIKAENVTDQGIFTGHASVFGVVDLDNDVGCGWRADLRAA